MAIEIKAPTLPESVPDGTIATWYKQEGDAVARDELLVDIETDKVLLEVVAPANGVLQSINKAEGDTIVSNELLALFEAGATAAVAKAEKEPGSAETAAEVIEDNSHVEVLMSPAAKKLIEENSLNPNSINSTGKDGRITKEDVLKHIEAGGTKAGETTTPVSNTSSASITPLPTKGARAEERVPMTRLRAKVAERLLEATSTTAMLTTFNEVNMQPIMDIRNRYKDMFEKKHDGTRLGFMSFFVRASIEALKQYPAVNASIDGSEIVYHGYQDIGVAVSSPRGLVVPVLRDADGMGFADIEKNIRAYGVKARDGKLTIDEMTGGTFTISNGGVFGSLLSTPILNPPQTAILGMHKIQERPMAVDGEVKILPMMYLALSYDHRMIDGKEAVQFLVTMKELLEDPARILLEV
ncbi:2-oxoglutarate dehydrogenase complex dihydrolipoyllysine-residue succinyltransferase [Haliea sp. AH-315-K21]|nr:2-oxoglutarate dehydrogenase complex dihydrolipoyllysine-residue succinyltransferase [Haliea sp. AH-315-K21]MBN4075686.1 2-oxoglutarate dehydrogenase complex dihydrolipoyllysine-residue succinyltransferase [Gammaproteobacteria bacterium AH-315-E17]